MTSFLVKNMALQFFLLHIQRRPFFEFCNDQNLCLPTRIIGFPNRVLPNTGTERNSNQNPAVNEGKHIKIEIEDGRHDVQNTLFIVPYISRANICQLNVNRRQLFLRLKINNRLNWQPIKIFLVSINRTCRMKTVSKI